MTNKKKIPIALAIAVVIILCGLIFVIADELYIIGETQKYDWQKEYTQEEFQSLPLEQRQYISEMRSCIPNASLRKVDFDCSYYYKEHAKRPVK